MENKLTVKDIVDFLDCDYVGDTGTEIKGFSASANSKSFCLTFLTEGYTLGIDFGAVILSKLDYVKRLRDFRTYLIVDNPKLAFARVLRKFYCKIETPFRIIGPTGLIHKTVCIEGRIVVSEGVKIQPYCTIGTEGFGHVKNEKGEWEEFPQIGGVLIGKNVEIAAGSNIHRGTLDDTVIMEGSKISTHCNIGHNCIIGKHVFIGGNTNLGGHTTIGDYSFIGMRVVTNPGIIIGYNCVVGMGSVVTQNIPDGCKAYGHPARVMERVG